MDQPPPCQAVLDEVGPRLRRLRAKRGLTLAALCEATGISKSTLSRLESGQRRPSLKLLLPLAGAYQVPLDDLVGVPEVGDPRVRLTPRTMPNGGTFVPLTRSPAPSRHTRSSSPSLSGACESRGFAESARCSPRGPPAPLP